MVFCSRKVLPKCCPSFQKLIIAIKAKLMFNSVLRALLQTFFMTSISMWNSLKQADPSSSKGLIDYASAITILLLAIAFIVLAYLNLERMYYKGNLSKAETKAKYDSIYANVDYRNPKALYNTSFFLARRLVLAFVIVYAARSLVLQVMIADVLSTALLIYYI